MTRARDTADTQDNLGGAVAPYVAGKNYVINGGFDIWQRGTTFTNPANNAYTADRWNNGNSASGTYTISQQSTGVPVGSQYYMRTTYGAASSYCNRAQIVETANTELLQGKTVTFTVKLRKNASLTTDFVVGIYKSATVDAGIAATWSGISTIGVTNASLPTGTTSADWYTATVTAAIPNDGTANSLRLLVNETIVQPSGAYWEMAQTQLEVGAVATPFARAGGSIGGELALCQRYYYRNTGGEVYSHYGIGMSISTSYANINVNLPVQMRVKPASVEYANLGITDDVNYQLATSGSGIVINWNSPTLCQVAVQTAASQTQYRVAFLSNQNNTAGYLGFSAEL
jgi:hypothetical protein